jgi:hypothetical protein
MKYWEIIADNLSKAGWSWGCVSAVDSNGRTIWIVDAHRGDGKRFGARAMKSRRRLSSLNRRFGLNTEKGGGHTTFRRRELKWKIQAKEMHYVRRYSSLSL